MGGVAVLRPIPGRILQSTALVEVCRAVDRYHNPVYDEYTVKRVHLQPTNEVRKSLQDTDLTLSGLLFVDARISNPALDWMALFQAANEAGGDMKVTVRDHTYTVKAVDALRDDTDKLHHWEVGLI